MRRIFLICVIIYAALSLIFVHWPAMAGTVGAESAPWLGLMVVDMGFAVAALVKLFGFGDLEEEGETILDADEIDVPDVWLYGLVGVFLLANLGYHGYESLFTQGAVSVYNSVWFMCEVGGAALTFIFFNHAQKVTKRLRRAATLAAKARAATGPRVVETTAANG